MGSGPTIREASIEVDSTFSRTENGMGALQDALLRVRDMEETKEVRARTYENRQLPPCCVPRGNQKARSTGVQVYARHAEGVCGRFAYLQQRWHQPSPPSPPSSVAARTLATPFRHEVGEADVGPLQTVAIAWMLTGPWLCLRVASLLRSCRLPRCPRFRNRQSETGFKRTRMLTGPLLCLRVASLLLVASLSLSTRKVYPKVVMNDHSQHSVPAQSGPGDVTSPVLDLPVAGRP
jgi:hypothetical protein